MRIVNLKKRRPAMAAAALSARGPCVSTSGAHCEDVAAATLPLVRAGFGSIETGSRSRSAINEGPVGRHPSFFCVFSLEAGMSRAAKWASQPK